MSCIFINAFSLREGGSLVVLRELLRVMHALHPDWSWQVATNEVALPHLPSLPRVHYQVAARRMLGGWRSLWWHQFVLPGLLKATCAKVLFSQTNYLPLRALQIPTLLLLQNAGHFSDVFRMLTLEAHPGFRPRLELELKNAWVRASLWRATRITVQTEALKQAMLGQTGIDGSRISVIPHGSGLVAESPAATGSAVRPQLPEDRQPLRIGYITKFGVQKNFAVLFAAAALLREQGVALRLVLTLGDGFGTGRVLAEAQHHGVADLIDNHGELAPDAIVVLYRSLHVFVFPSLCESFGFPMVEALASGLPLLVAGTASNIELAGEGALVFPPHDAAALAEGIAALRRSPAAFARQAERSLQRAAHFSWFAAGAATASLLQELMPPEEGA